MHARKSLQVFPGERVSGARWHEFRVDTRTPSRCLSRDIVGARGTQGLRDRERGTEMERERDREGGREIEREGGRGRGGRGRGGISVQGQSEVHCLRDFEMREVALIYA